MDQFHLADRPDEITQYADGYSVSCINNIVIDMRLVWLALLLVFRACWRRPTLDLMAWHQTLKSLHGQAGVSAVNPGAGPSSRSQSTSYEIGSDRQLGPIEKEGDETKASDRIDKALEDVSVAPPKDDQNLLGSIWTRRPQPGNPGGSLS